MARACLLAFIVGLLLEEYGLAAETPEDNTGALFVTQQAANTVLRRLRRYNSGHLEEVYKDNLERECREETCTMEEARECFEDDEKTMEFWAGYVDGDQCNPQPCQNGAVCTDGVNAYTCWCKPNFRGQNCEIEVATQCHVNNGGCSHFCAVVADQAVCQCAAGYRLGSDKRRCEPTEQFSCGRVEKSPGTRTFLSPRSWNTTRHPDGEHNSSDTVQDDFYELNITELFDYYDTLSNDSNLYDVPAESVLDIRSARSDSSPSVNDDSQQIPAWAFPTLPTIEEEKNTDERIVGGDEASPGEIPWQVTLMSHSASLQRAQPFCGGSLLSELWVITAAHCLKQADTTKQRFFVRVGEHDVTRDEGTERDHTVAEQHVHHMYDHNKSPYNHDIALLKLSNPVELSNNRRPICLGPKDFTENLLRESPTSLVSGWGRLKFQGLEATKLQKLAVPYVERTPCKQSSRAHVTRFMFCAGYLNDPKDSCQGDSGGPHATKHGDTWFLTGIVSWGEECAKDGKYGIYTRVSKYYPWISQKTGIRISM